MSELIRRRALLHGLTLGASTGLIARSTPALADDPPVIDEQDAKAKPDPIEREIDARMQIILARYGDQLDEPARSEIRRQVADVVHRGRALRAMPLDNGVGPFPVFTPYRAPLTS